MACLPRQHQLPHLTSSNLNASFVANAIWFFKLDAWLASFCKWHIFIYPNSQSPTLTTEWEESNNKDCPCNYRNGSWKMKILPWKTSCQNPCFCPTYLRDHALHLESDHDLMTSFWCMRYDLAKPSIQTDLDLPKSKKTIFVVPYHAIIWLTTPIWRDNNLATLHFMHSSLKTQLTCHWTHVMNRELD